MLKALPVNKSEPVAEMTWFWAEISRYLAEFMMPSILINQPQSASSHVQCSFHTEFVKAPHPVDVYVQL